MRRSALVLLAAAAIAWFLLLPPVPHALPPPGPGLSEPLRGAIHIHTRRSDGTGTLEEVASAASRAGLKFIIVTDHGDGTRAPGSPRYVSGVLCIDAVEISTGGGHLVALGLARAPYPLAGESRDVVEDVKRLGGFAVVAHPDSRKPELRWANWSAPVDGLEWINGDSEWRDERPLALVHALLTYPFRPSESLASILDRPEATIQRWDELTRHRRVVALAAADAHARLGLKSVGEPYDNSPSLHLPSYEAVFRTFSIALPDRQLTDDPARDARAVVDAIRAGHVYSIVDAVGGRGVLAFTAASGGRHAGVGDVLPVGGPVTLDVQIQGPSNADILLRRQGTTIARAKGTALQHVTTDAGVYRVEVELPESPGQPPVPWIVSNPIYVGQPWAVSEPAQAADAGAAPRGAVTRSEGDAREWTVEHSPGSAGAIDAVPAVPRGTQLHLRYALSGAASASPFVAFVLPAGPMLATHDRLIFTARADHPLRLSVQLRAPVGEQGERWHRSVYVDTAPRTMTIPFDDLSPIGPTSQPMPALEAIQSVLFVIDTVNTSVGTNGQIWIDEVKYAR